MTTVGNRAEVLDYFAKKAARYDEVDQQVYWRLSDELLWHLLTTVVLPELPAAFTFLDAGGGTGRWSQRIAAAFPESRGTLVDLSPDMLREARRKFTGAAAGRVRVLEGSIESLPELESGAFDLVFNFHNVLGFVADPGAVVTELARLTRTGGTLLSVVPNRFHAAYFNIALGRLDEAERCVRESRGRFTTDMPYMHLFTPGSMLELYARAGLTRGEVRGFPVATYPGFAETQIEGNTRSLSDLLADPRNFEQIFELEAELSKLPEAAARGNNLFAFARK